MKQGEHSLKMHDTCFFLQPELSSLMLDLKVELFPLPQHKSSSGVSNDVMNFLSKSTRVLSSSKGLILCHTRSNLLSQFFVCNPITKSWVPIPFPNKDHVEEEKYEVDPIMVLVECIGGNSENYMIFYFQGPTDWSSSFPCKFFNSKEGLWQQMEKNFFAGGRNLKFNMPVCCNGAIHFISDCGTYLTRASKFFMPYIMSYNLESGTTRMLKLPEDATWDFDDDSCDMSIFNWGKSSICLVKLLRSVFTIWILTDYESQNWFRLLTLYCKLNSINHATKLFQCTHNPNVYLYTSLIDGFVSFGSYTHAIKLFNRMLRRHVFADNYVVTAVLKACVLQRALTGGREVHGLVSKYGLGLDSSIALKLVEFYVECGVLDDAWNLFDEMPERDVVACSVMMGLCFDCGMVEEAIGVFNEMGIRDTVWGLWSSWIHTYMHKCDVKVNPFVAGALINMYSRCGDIDEARTLFDEVRVKDVSTYNSMIGGLALHGKSIEAVDHGGLVDLGFEIFQSMETVHGIKPEVEHYGCMVDILGRVGRLEEALDFIAGMGVEADDKMLCSLLSAFKIHKNIEIGEKVAKLVSEHSRIDSGSFIMLSNFYASLGRWNNAAEVRDKMEKGGIQKEPGCSSIEVNNAIHEFLSGDRRHPEGKRIYKKLDELNCLKKFEGYSPATEVALHDVDDEQKELHKRNWLWVYIVRDSQLKLPQHLELGKI
ncbi:hypothetical protein VNO78_33055 [Psophocarpus tetragonolobus]|uniref:F-box associated beta-propeller type 3 domain-containing protein n=1 Tax=Psophocarpus tetragonolobus TaxID=3891 RepID=A0AAN9P0F6_PSOTE